MPPHYGTGSGDYRKIAFEHYPEQCNRCGFKEHMEILQVHHKDCDTQNNKPENLEVLCPNCHNWEHYLTCSGLYNNLTTAG